MPTLTMLAEQGRRRAALLLAVVAVVAALIAAGTVLAVADPQGATPASPPTRVSSSRSGPKPDSTHHRAPADHHCGPGAHRAAGRHRRRGQLQQPRPPAATDLDNRITDISRSLCNLAGHDRPKVTGDLPHKVSDLVKHIADPTESGQLTSAGQRQMDDPLAALERLIPPNS